VHPLLALSFKHGMAVPSGAQSAEPGPCATSLHPPQRSKPVDVPRQDQDVGLGNRTIGSRRRRRALLPGLPQPEQGHPVAILQSHGGTATHYAAYGKNSRYSLSITRLMGFRTGNTINYSTVTCDLG
jgi:hypothetical protein